MAWFVEAIVWHRQDVRLPPPADADLTGFDPQPGELATGRPFWSTHGRRACGRATAENSNARAEVLGSRVRLILFMLRWARWQAWN